MFKKILVLALLFAPITLFAQYKFGHLDTQEIFNAMPEAATVNKTLQDLATTYQKQLTEMQNEYNRQVKQFVDQRDSLPAAIQQARQSEIADMEQRINTLNQTAKNDIQKKQQELIQPIVDKIKKAIEEVGKENGFTYIFDMQVPSIVYQSDQSIDVTPLVLKQLGITPGATSAAAPAPATAPATKKKTK
ncbi:OmpH family outer membrane protein [Microbacter margulisiae]|uniref:Outer membrane protein n=1 Tax=Microbacter margulisiae TaxID=1350067 RepID=A0A7W5H1H7_9PORP|nr:OmpH family outer membrane protein [Microbacter margulisiae]MBB3186710.1 outer membrane protein [Microbacter margulisiae]